MDEIAMDKILNAFPNLKYPKVKIGLNRNMRSIDRTRKSSGLFALLALITLLLAPPVANADADPNSNPGTPYYIVPAEHGQGRAESYQVANVMFSKGADQVRTLSYSLPEDLVGLSWAGILLREATPAVGKNSIYLNGAGVAATCSIQAVPKQMNCVMAYDDGFLAHSVDSSAVSEFLHRKYGSDPELLSTKLLQSARFLKGPEGVLVLPESYFKD